MNGKITDNPNINPNLNPPLTSVPSPTSTPNYIRVYIKDLDKTALFPSDTPPEEMERAINEAITKYKPRPLHTAIGEYIGELAGTRKLRKAYEDVGGKPVALEKPEFPEWSMKETLKAPFKGAAETVLYGTPIGRAAAFGVPLAETAVTGIAGAATLPTDIGRYIGERLGTSKLQQAYEKATGRPVKMEKEGIQLTLSESAMLKTQEVLEGVNDYIAKVPLFGPAVAGRPQTVIGKGVAWGFEKAFDLSSKGMTKVFSSLGFSRPVSESVGGAVGDAATYLLLYMLGGRKPREIAKRLPEKVKGKFASVPEPEPHPTAEGMYKLVPEFKAKVDNIVKETGKDLDSVLKDIDMDAARTEYADVISKFNKDVWTDPQYIDKMKRIAEEKDARRRKILADDLTTTSVNNMLTYLNSPESLKNTAHTLNALAEKRLADAVTYRERYVKPLQEARQQILIRPKEVRSEELKELYPRPTRLPTTTMREEVRPPERPFEEIAEPTRHVIGRPTEGAVPFTKTEIRPTPEPTPTPPTEPTPKPTKYFDKMDKLREKYREKKAGLKETVSGIKKVVNEADKEGVDIRREAAEIIGEIGRVERGEITPTPTPPTPTPTPTTAPTQLPPQPRPITKDKVKRVEEELRQATRPTPEPTPTPSPTPLSLKQQKEYILGVINEELKTAPSVKELTKQPDIVTIDIPDDGTFTVTKTKEALGRFRNSIIRKFPTTVTLEPTKPKTPKITPTGKRIVDEGVEYYNKFRPRKDEKIKYGKINMYLEPEGLYTNGIYAIKIPKPKDIKLDPPSLNLKEAIPKDLQEAKIVGEFKTFYDTKALVHVVGRNGDEAVLNSSYVDNILTLYPDATVKMATEFGEGRPVVFESKGKVVGLVQPMRDVWTPEFFNAYKPRMDRFKNEAFTTPSITPTTPTPTLPSTSTPLPFDTFVSTMKYDTSTPESLTSAINAYRSYLDTFADTPESLTSIDLMKFIKDNKGTLNIPKDIINKLKDFTNRQPKQPIEKANDNIKKAGELFATVRLREQPEVVKYFSGVRGKIRQWCDTLSYIETIFPQAQPAINALRGIQEKRGLVSTQSLEATKIYFELPKESRLKVDRYIKERELQAEAGNRMPDPTLDELIAQGFTKDEANGILALRKFQKDIATNYIKQALTTFYNEEWFGEYKIPRTIEESNLIARDISNRLADLRRQVRWADVEGKSRKEQRLILEPYLKEIDRLKGIAKINQSVRQRVLKPVKQFEVDWYSPEVRFGDYFVVVRNPQAKPSDPLAFFNKVNSMKEAQQLAYTLAKDPKYKGMEIEYGKEYKSSLEELNRMSPSLVSTTQNVINDLIKRG